MRADCGGDERIEPESGMGRAVLGIALLAQLQAVDHGIGEFTDTELQRAAVADQGRGLQADAVVHRAYGQARGAIGIVLVARMVDDEVEAVLRDDGIPQHERHAPVDRTDHGQRCAGGPRRGEAIEQVEGEVRIRRQAVLRTPGHRSGTD